MYNQIKRTFAYLGPYKRLVVTSQLCMLISVAVTTLFPWTIKNIFDVALKAKDSKMLMNSLVMLTIVFVLGQMARYKKNYTEGYIGQRIITDMRNEIYEKLQRLPISYYDKNKSGDIVSKITNDLTLIQQILASGLNYALEKCMTLIVVLVILIRLDPLLTIAGLAVVPLTIFTAKVMGDKAKIISKRVQQQLGMMMSILTESIQGIKVIKAFVVEKDAVNLYGKENDSLLKKNIKSIRIKEKSNMLIGLLAMTQLLMVTGVGSYRVFTGHLSPGSLIAFILYCEMLTEPIGLLAGIYIEVKKTSAAVNRIFSIIDSEEEHVRSSHIKPDIKGHITFEKVSFAYPTGDEVFSDLTFDIEEGETVAFVGPSGVGKSTILKLIARFFSVKSGHIKVDGHNIQDIHLHYLRNHIGIVPQETYLFGLSVSDNISLGCPHATEKDITQAAILANAHEFVMELPEGYNTVLHEGGTSISGGQRQRIAIARAFLKDPKILLLDEATASLDNHSESKIQHALDMLMHKRTTLIVAHRLATIKNAHRIILLNEGKVIGIGSHKELLSKNTFYHSLYKKQLLLNK